MLIVFDIDGTLANIEHRLHHIKTKPKNWDAFDAGIKDDKVNSPVARMYWAMANMGHTIVIATGRNERNRAETEAWLRKKIGSEWKTLYMRSEDDRRDDTIVKREMLDKIVRDYGRKPDAVFEDRPRVVQMWRNEGVFVFDVYQGQDDF